jgi:murein DD-endopeptidase MepM/ murein hydrolase activator NlpD
MEIVYKPVEDGYITSGYGNRILNGKREFHPGIDIGSKQRTPFVYSPYAGTVHEAGYSESFGKRVWIRIESGMYMVIAHLITISPNIHKGMKIISGEYIGIMGNTGMSYGRHTHIELRSDPQTPGNSIDPIEITKTLQI